MKKRDSIVNVADGVLQENQKMKKVLDKKNTMRYDIKVAGENNSTAAKKS